MAQFGTLLHSGLAQAGCEAVRDVTLYWLADSLAHVGIAGIVSSLVILRDWAVAWLWAGLALIVVKELAFDLPNAGWSGLVWLDSGWDVTCWLTGFLLQWWAIMDRGER